MALSGNEVNYWSKVLVGEVQKMEGDPRPRFNREIIS